MRRLIIVPAALLFALQVSCQKETVADRISDKSYPSIFQAWNPIDMKDFPLETHEQRLMAAVKHDILWEEPVSQLGYGVKLVLGTIWDHEYQGLADDFTESTRTQALKNRAKMLEINPDMVLLMEIRWKDAPGSYLPAESDWWMRDENGERKVGWTGGPEPYYYLNYRNAEFRDNIRKQAKIARESGIYDGVMLDWWGSHGENDPDAMDFLKKIREGIGEDGIIIVNNDRISPLPISSPYINGAFMEMKYDTHHSVEGWEKVRTDLLWFEENLRKPVLNCLNIQAGDMQEMRAGLCMSLIFSNGSYLFAANENSDPSPDHLHKWYKEYDMSLGKPVSSSMQNANGTYAREFDNGWAIYNPRGNGDQVIQINGKEYSIHDRDGKIILEK